MLTEKMIVMKRRSREQWADYVNGWVSHNGYALDGNGRFVIHSREPIKAKAGYVLTGVQIPEDCIILPIEYITDPCDHWEDSLVAPSKMVRPYEKFEHLELEADTPIQMYFPSYERCPHCGADNTFNHHGLAICEVCGKYIVTCASCLLDYTSDNSCAKCTLERQAHMLNWETY